MATKDICPEQCDMSVLSRVVDFIIPEDDFPSASEAGVSEFLLGLWKSGAESSGPLVFEGLRRLDREVRAVFGVAFVDATARQKDEIVLRHAHAPWFATLCELVAEGYYSNPGNGSNPHALSWRMIGYEPGLPDGPDGPPSNMQDMVRGKLCA
ncbi:gluconate 2-dehydrogenase subunit 3 family protein [Mesorhizobium sp. M1076]|uniref:gluconate 2-dehydrogenase subunit 3 family protein n=1 Tax=Mesorhizobium sp. M1076 TaxID=2957054 RepID=UPI003337D981